MKAYKKQVTKYYKWGDPNITLVGSPTVSDGVVSGFSTSKYLVIPNNYKSNNATYAFKFTTGSDVTTLQCVAHAELLFNLEVTEAGYLDTYLFGTQKAYALFKLNSNTTYWVKVAVNGVTKTYSYSTDGITFKTTHTLEDTGMNPANTSYQFRLGLNSYEKNKPFLGSIDLKECYIETNNNNNNKIWTGLKQVESTSSDYDFSKIVDVYTMLKTDPVEVKFPNATMVGSPTVNNTVVSGFSASNYLNVTDSFNVTGKTWEIVFKIKTGGDVTTLQSLTGHTGSQNYDPVSLLVYSNHFRLSLCYTSSAHAVDEVGSYTVSANTEYWVKFGFDGSKYVLSYSLNGVDYIEDLVVNSTTSIWTSNLVIGRQQGGTSEHPWLGSIDLNGCYININGQRWWTGTKSVTKYKYYTVGG